MMLASLIDTEALGRVILYAFIVSVGVTAVFSVGIVGVTRFDERRRAGGGGIGYAVLAGVCGLVVAAVVIEAIVIMARK